MKKGYYVIPIIALAFYGVLSIIRESGVVRESSRLTAEIIDKDCVRSNSATVVESIVGRKPSGMPMNEEKDSVVPQHRLCVGLGSEEDMDNLLSKYKQVFVIMPAKAAGTALKMFTKACMEAANTTSFANLDNPLPDPSKLEKSFRSELRMPSLVTSHLYNSEHFCKMMKQTTKDTLLVYSHREETSRLISAIRHVLRTFVCPNMAGLMGKATIVGNECQVKEGVLIEKIRKRRSEMGLGSTQILPCEAYECIKDNSPNLVFTHYKQANELQKLLAKHYCPEVTQEVNVGYAEDVRSGNTGMPVSIVLEDGTLVPLDDWLNAKSQLVELVLDLKRDVSCQATTRDIEHEMLACPSETLQISGRSYGGHKMEFPL